MTQSVTELSLPTPKERRRLRDAAELTHEEVAAAVGVTATTVRSWETGRTDPRGRKREAYAKFLTRLAATGGTGSDQVEQASADVGDVADAADEADEAAAGAAPAASGGAESGGAPAAGTEPRAGAAAPPEPPAVPGTPTRPAWANGTATPAAEAATAPVVEPEAAAVADASEEPGAVTEAVDTGTDEASAVNSAEEGHFGLHAHPRALARPVGAQTRPKAAVKRAAKPPVGVPRHEAKATVKAAVGGGGGLATLRPGGTIPPGPGTGQGATGNATGTGTGTGPGDDGPGDDGPGNDGPGAANPGTSARTAPEGATGAAPEGAADDDGTDESPAPKLPTPESAFDALYNRTAPALTRQAYLLTGRRGLAHEAVERAFQQAWGRWPEVATDPDPVGWVRAAAYEYALSPWHQFRRAHKHPDKPPADPGDRILMDAMLALPPAHRRTVLLYDGVGLDLPDTAAETEASTPTAGNRLVNAHAELADRLPELADVAPGKQSALLRERLGTLRPAVRLEPRSAAVVRAAGESRIRRWTRAALGLTAVIAAATAYTAVTAPTSYEPPLAPGANVSGVPPHSGPQQLTDEGRQLHDKLLSDPAAGPARISPKPE
ncbi:helix-turn-helix domain-containing protein [Streptomyces sp. NPDC059411]|uniref:helix-turn-helix domain-containing protein n=1 Tax=Streptomyces sp. NPDC059411 TaxID=3346825 RepID=UPI0036BDA920